MVHIRRFVLVVIIPLALQVAAGGSPNREDPATQAIAAPEGGLIVELIDPGSAAGDAGLRSGDRLISWERTEAGSSPRTVASGEFRTPFDAREFEVEQLPRGSTRIIADRSGTRLVFELLPGAWDLVARPPFAPSLLEDYATGLAAAASGDATAAMDALRPVVDRLTADSRFADAAWLLSRASALLIRSGQGDEAEPAFIEALEHAGRTTPGFEADVWEVKQFETNLRMSWRTGLSPSLSRAASESRRTARALREKHAPDSLALAQSRFGEANPRVARWEDTCGALATQERLAPGSFDHARSLWFISSRLAAEFRQSSEAKTLLCDGTRPTRSDAIALETKAREILVRVAPNHTVTALMLALRGNSALGAQDNLAASDLLRQSLAILDAAGPRREFQRQAGLFYWALQGSEPRFEQKPLDFLLGSLGLALRRIGELDASEAILRRALLSQPDYPYLIDSLAWTLSYRGDVAGAEALHYQLRAVAEPYRPVTSDDERRYYPLASALTNLGQDAYLRGDLQTAAALYARALAHAEEDAQAALDNSLAMRARIDENRARSNLPPQPPDDGRFTNITSFQCGHNVRQILLYLTDVSMAKGDYDLADRFLERSAQLDEECTTKWSKSLEGGRVDPQGGFLLRRGRIAEARGDLGAAETAYQTALERARRSAPSTVSAALQALGGARRAAGKLNAAREVLDEALALRAQQAPGSRWHAETLHSLGLVQRDFGQAQLADQLLRAAIDMLDRQRAQLGGTGLARLNFAERVTAYYRDYVEFLLEHGRPAEAFAVLERAHARATLEMLAERRVNLAADIPEPLARERDRLAAEYDRTQDEILSLDPVKNKAETERGVQKLYQLQAQLDATAARIQQASPRAAALEYAKPLTVAGARAALDPGTVLLSYAVSQQRTFLFVVTPSQPGAAPAMPTRAPEASSAARLTVFTIPAGEEDLRQRVQAFRRLIDWQATGSDDPAIRAARSRELYDLLVRPAESLIAPARRIVLSLDGPLSLLPFAALVRGGTNSAPQHLIEWKPVHTTLSATVYADLRTRRPSAPRAASTIVAFGDPMYPAVTPRSTTTSPDAAGQDVVPAQDWPLASGLDPQVQFFVRGGMNLVPLPGSRREVEALGRLFGRSATIFLGANATEERAKAVGPNARILHFAVHGVVTPRFPLNSGLALTIPDKRKEGSDNGLLQAWEIFERMRLDADLVTLSACESALGAEIRGEGHFGLIRAFEYAGARSVLASLWKVGDEATSELMRRFYTNVKAGQSKDEALRNAQLALIHAAERGLPARLALPLNWAAFQLDGDWR